jgi:2-phosphosulfolactate phosphatase
MILVSGASLSKPAPWLAGTARQIYHPDMTRKLRVHLLPMLFEPEELQGAVAVMIDVLRASTTIVHALAAGARAVIPCETVEEARKLAAQHGPQDVLLGGERGGTSIERFDLDNSPLSYSSEMVRGKTVVLTTTNGTLALARMRCADRVLVGAFVNQKGVVDQLADDSRPVHLVCAGTDGKITSEDILCAGTIAAELAATGNFDDADDATRLARDNFLSHGTDGGTLRTALRASRGGRNLVRLGFDDDIERSAMLDLFSLVPEYHAESGRIEDVAQPTFPNQTSADYVES